MGFWQASVPVVNVEPNENMEFACPPSIPPFGGQRTSCVGRRRVGGLQIPSQAPFGEPRATAPTRRPASLGVLLSIRGAPFRRCEPTPLKPTLKAAPSYNALTARPNGAEHLGLIRYFVGATVSHLRVSDIKGIGSAAFMLVLAAGALAFRISQPMFWRTDIVPIPLA